MPTAVALLVAAGRGERLGHDQPKAFVPCAGRPLIAWSLDALQAVDDVEHVVAALPPGITAPHGVIGVPGGAERSAGPSRPDWRVTGSWCSCPPR